jgi:Fe2+ transport system protein B
VALVGNPKCGQVDRVQRADRRRHHVGNWPGKTVQIASGRWTTAAGPVTLIDLPGTYSLTPHSPDEELVRDVLAGQVPRGRPDVVVAVVDAANLARSLYLLAQVLDTGAPVVVALTMLDIAADRGLLVDREALAARSASPWVEVRARDGQPLNALAAAVLAARPTRATIGRRSTTATRRRSSATNGFAAWCRQRAAQPRKPRHPLRSGRPDRHITLGGSAAVRARHVGRVRRDDQYRRPPAGGPVAVV